MENAKNVKGKKLVDHSEVAKDGYNALLKGDGKVVSGFKNKIQVAMSDIMPDSMLANRVHKQQEPAEDGKNNS